MSANNQVSIKIEIMNVVNKCMLKIKSTYDSIALIYHTVKAFDGTAIPPLETDNLPIKIETNETKSIEQSKQDTFNWLFRKAFEDFIVGINESLIEAYIVAKLVDLQKENHQGFTTAEVQAKIDAVYKRPVKMHIPMLIDEIEKSIGKNLYLKLEILSINKVRNCLVHRNGIVGSEDTNNLRKTALVLTCQELKIYRDENGEMIPLVKEDKNKGVLVTKAGFKVLPMTIEFQIGSHIDMNPDVLNAITYTSVTFVQELLKSLPTNFQPQNVQYRIDPGV